MVISDTCERHYHWQCLSPPRSVVPDGSWHCHLCDEAHSNLEEICRAEDPIPFPRLRDPYHSKHAFLLAAYVHAQEATLLAYKHSLSPGQHYSVTDA